MKSPAVIVVKKGKRGHAGHHGGAWKVAYADFVTAMMAFFLVMWLVAQSNSVRQAVAGYFKDPGIFDNARSNGPIAGGDFRLDPKPPHSGAGAGGPAPQEATQAKDRADLAKAARRLKESLGQMPEFKRLGKQIDIELTPEGLRIELLEARENSFFDSGSAVLKPDTEHILATISHELGTLANDVVLEGHTDASPYTGSDTYTNWELSVDRANAARRIMQRNGVQPKQVVAVRGFADTKLRLPASPLDPRNRRVSILVQRVVDPASAAADGGPEQGGHRGNSAAPAPATAH